MTALRKGLVLAFFFAAAGLANCAATAAPEVPKGFEIRQIATVPGARALAFAPDGTLFVGTRDNDVYEIAHAGGTAAQPRVFAHFDDAPAAGVAFADGYLYVGTQHAIWRLAYPKNGESGPSKLAAVRGGSPPPGSDGDVHTTTSVAAYGKDLYASVGSSCNACVETDVTRATIGRVRGGRYEVIAKRNRNAIALAVDPQTGALWEGTAGEDDLPPGHPYEIFDDVTAHPGVADYGWPFCYEDQKTNPVKAWSGQSCKNAVVPRAVFPPYETPTAAVFYPARERGRYAFPAKYGGGAFVALHGSWHGPAQGLSGFEPPRVVFVPMRGDSPVHPVNWNDPATQWTDFAAGYQQGGSAQRSGRPAGLAVGPQGALFISDDQTGAIYRVRPGRP